MHFRLNTPATAGPDNKLHKTHISALRIWNAKGWGLVFSLTETKPFIVIESNDFTIDFQRMAFELYQTYKELRRLEDATFRRMAWNSGEHERLYKRVGQLGLILHIANGTENNLSDTFPAFPNGEKWAGIEYHRFESWYLYDRSANYQNIKYAFITRSKMW